LFLSIDDLIGLRDQLFDSEEFMTTYAARPTLVTLLEALNQQFASALALGFFDLGLGEHRDVDLRFVDAVVDQISARLDAHASYVAPWDAGFALGNPDDPDAGYYFSPDKRLLFVFVAERADEGDFLSNRQRIDTIRRAIGTLAPDFVDVRAGVTGGPVIAD